MTGASDPIRSIRSDGRFLEMALLHSGHLVLDEQIQCLCGGELLATTRQRCGTQVVMPGDGLTHCEDETDHVKSMGDLQDPKMEVRS